jgi:hypothetical protein
VWHPHASTDGKWLESMWLFSFKNNPDKAFNIDYVVLPYSAQLYAGAGTSDSKTLSHRFRATVFISSQPTERAIP